MNTQRRIFRGRGGPTDGRLPKHNARRRKKQQSNNNQGDAVGYGQAPADVSMTVWEDNDEVDLDKSESSSSYHVEALLLAKEDLVDETETIILEPQQQAVHSTAHGKPLSLGGDNKAPAVFVDTEEQQEPPPWRSEIQHLKGRVRNVQESIQLGSEGIANPTTYQQNVLNAVENCIHEWRAILRHYANNNIHHDNNNSDATTAATMLVLDPQVVKETSLQVYMLLQLSIQCGPLTCGKPGYFKRCGGDVARIVLEFLNKVVPEEESSECCRSLQFSPKQAGAIAIWRNNASKAVEDDKPPSKSALKKQQGTSKKKRHKK